MAFFFSTLHGQNITIYTCSIKKKGTKLICGQLSVLKKVALCISLLTLHCTVPLTELQLQPCFLKLQK